MLRRCRLLVVDNVSSNLEERESEVDPVEWAEVNEGDLWLGSNCAERAEAVGGGVQWSDLGCPLESVAGWALF